MKKPIVKTSIFIGGGVLLLLSLGLASTLSQGDETLFSWDPITRGEIRETISASGEIQAKTRINIGTNVAGEIKERLVKDGQDVKAGDLLVVIDPVRLKQQLSQAEAVLEGARKDSERLEGACRRARENFKAMESLYRQGLLSSEDYRQSKLNCESSELSYAAAKANVSQNLANVAATKDGLEKTTIRAPIAGRVTSLKAERGEMAIPGTSNLPGAVLMVISDMHEINAEIKVNESEVVRLRVGQSAQVAVDSLPGRVFHGKVYEINSTAEQGGQDANMYKVKVALEMSSPDIARLRPGMSVRGTVLTAEAKSVVRVPLQAVQERDGTPEEARAKGLLNPESRSVVMVYRDGKAHERSIRTGIANSQYYEVLEGLAEGDKVVTGPLRKLKELKGEASVRLKKKSDAQLEQTLQKAQGTAS